MCALITDISYDDVLDIASDDDSTETVYNAATTYGHGPTYSYWDSKSVAACECDAPFFGPDCSQSTLLHIFTIDFHNYHFIIQKYLCFKIFF